ncbi:MAG TPA: energy transducer TonB [Longimicrobiales bacterium]|nr:energy transducer TonB [Longimicrobiales bacterium]
MHPQTEATIHARHRHHESRSYWGGLLIAVALHFALFVFAPGMTVAGMGGDARADVIVIEPPSELPPPPEPPEIRRPPVPVIGAVDIDATLPKSVDFRKFPDLPAPPVIDRGERPFEFTPRDVEPALKNTRDIQRLLERSYPPVARDAGIGGSVLLWLYIDIEGNVLETRVHESSGVDALDQAAREVASEMRFRPAQYRSRPVPVWVAQRIEFTTRK